MIKEGGFKVLRKLSIGVLIAGLLFAVWFLAANSGCTNSALLGSVCSEETRSGFEHARMFMGSWVCMILAFMTGDFFNIWNKSK